MRRVVAGHHGFTLLEIIVVLAVIGALGAMLGPIAFGYIEDGNIRRTQVDAQRLAVAVNKNVFGYGSLAVLRRWRRLLRVHVRN